jgi:hypothetical protein
MDSFGPLRTLAILSPNVVISWFTGFLQLG